MLTFAEAQTQLLAAARVLAPERVGLFDAFGRVLLEPLLARTPLPPFAYSAMDGIAVATSDLRGPGPWELPVLGESRTGRPSQSLVPGHACSISTGAEVPAGADAVLPREVVEATADAVRFSERARPGQHIRRAAEDLAPGDVALEAGTRLGAAQLALAAALDATELVVARRPRVTILCTGDELRAPGSAKVPGKIPESVSIALACLARSAGAIVRVVPPVGDERSATERSLAGALADTELLLTVGGVSVGDHDWVRPALESAGVELAFWKVAMKPGKPIAFGKHQSGRPSVLALPGNPASAFITFASFGMPLLRAMQGDRRPLPRASMLPLGARFSRKAGRLELIRVRLEGESEATRVYPFENQASGALTTLAWADALAIIPAETAELELGAPVAVLRISDF